MFALAELPEVQVAIAQPLLPALSLCMSAIAGVEELSLVSGLGVLICIGGAVEFTSLNSAGGAAEEGGGHSFGYAMLAFELVCYAAQLVYMPRVSRKYQPITLTAMYYTVATVCTAGTLLWRESDQLGSLAGEATGLANPMMAAGLAFAVLGPTVYSYCALSWTAKKLQPSVTSSYMTLQPVFVAVLSFLLYGATLSAGEIGAGAIVILGLYLSVIGNPATDRAWYEYAKNFPENIPETIDQLQTATANAAETVVEASTDLAKSTASAAVTAVDASTTAIGDAASATVDAIGDAANATVDAIGDMANAVVSVAPSGRAEEVDDRTPVGARVSSSEKRAERDESSPAGRR